MNRLPSAEFRVKYAKLTEPTVVTVLGHDIGEWIPYRGQPVDDTAPNSAATSWKGQPAPKPSTKKANGSLRSSEA